MGLFELVDRRESDSMIAGLEEPCSPPLTRDEWFVFLDAAGNILSCFMATRALDLAYAYARALLQSQRFLFAVSQAFFIFMRSSCAPLGVALTAWHTHLRAVANYVGNSHSRVDVKHSCCYDMRLLLLSFTLKELT